MLHSAITLDSSMKTTDAIKALTNYHDDAVVVIRRRKGTEIYWYTKKVADFRKFDITNLATLENVFGLHEPMGSQTYQIRLLSRDQIDTLSGVLLDGERVVGILVAPPSSGPRSTFAIRADTGPKVDFEVASGQHTEEVFVLSPGGQPVATTSESRPAQGQISPYPRLYAPDNVSPSQEFDLIIGLSSERVDGVAGGPMKLTIAEEEFDMTVQVFADGFHSPEADGLRRTLRVNRSSFEKAETKVKLIAPQTDDLLVTVIEVQYSYKSNVVGKVWREIRVVPVGNSVPEKKPKTGVRAISNLEPGSTPDLTVTITVGRDDRVLLWSFDTDLIPVLSYREPPRSEFDQDSARTFAFNNVKSIVDADGTDLIDDKLRGVGRTIARKMPREFWEVLAKVWSQTKETRGEVPSLLLISEDPYIPWELAITEKPYIGTSLVDASRPPFLGAQVKVGRWLPAGPSMPEGLLYPRLPPEVGIDITKLALVVGEYKGTQALPEAIEEGKELKTVYPAVWLNATRDDLNDLLDDSLRVEGEPVSVQAVHFACHGAVFPADAKYSGIVLSDTGLRLGEDMVIGNKMTQEHQPFVFINACEVGMASETLGAYGGLAAAFLNEGCRGFIAPLWKVNDKIAREIAVNFYKQALVKGDDVSEALRETRRGFSINGTIPASTYLAYIFYGHPNLVLHKAS